jgi:Ran GTPase-activating protein (RanGAP) involved in mRNA processing and transport
MDEYADRYFETTLKCLTMNMPDLFSVDLSHHDLSQDKLVRLAEALWHNTHLQALDLFANNAHAGQYHGWHKLGQALARLPKLVEIDVGNCQLGDAGLVLFLGEDAQSAGPEHVASVGDVAVLLSTIDLSNNALTDHSALLVAKFVKRQSALEELALHTNHWTDHVVPIFADALADKPQLRKVWLQKSGLSSEGVTQLRALLPSHVTLMV